MDLSEKLKVTTIILVVKIPSLEVDTAYPFIIAEKVQIKFGETMLLTLQDSNNILKSVFLPKRYGSLFANGNINSINENKVSLALKYVGICPTINPIFWRLYKL
jgi:hypothetical protein